VLARLGVIQNALRDEIDNEKQARDRAQESADEERRQRWSRRIYERHIRKRAESEDRTYKQKTHNQQVFIGIVAFAGLVANFVVGIMMILQWREMTKATRASEGATNLAAQALYQNQYQFRVNTDIAQGEFEKTLRQMQAQTKAQWGAVTANQASATAATSSAKTARDALVIGNRPWIKVVPRIVQPLTFDQLRNAGPMAIMTLVNHIENVGQSVALNLTTYEEIFPVGLDLGPALARRQERCDAYRHSHQADAGSVRFPHDPLDEGQIVGATMVDIKKVIDEDQKNPTAKGTFGSKVSFVLIGCVNYRSSFEPEDAPRHQTAFFYWLGVPTGDGTWFSAVAPSGVAAQLQLIETPLYFSAD
jgi:hypothetical protein